MAANSDDSPDELTLQVEGDQDAPARLLRISRPFRSVHQRLVRVREWTGADWTGQPRDFEVAAEVMYAELERDLRARRQLSRELYEIRLWLDGRPI